MSKKGFKTDQKGQCPSHKVRFPTHLAAKIALSNVHRADKPGHDECRVYRCWMCHGWHMTSQSKKEQE